MFNYSPDRPLGLPRGNVTLITFKNVGAAVAARFSRVGKLG